MIRHLKMRLWWQTLVLSVGGSALVTAALVASSHLTLQGGSIIVAALTVIALASIGLQRRAIARIDGYLSRLKNTDGDVSPPDDTPEDMKSLANNVTALHRFWRQKNSEIKDHWLADEAILDILPDPMIVVDPFRRITHMNAQARFMFKSVTPGQDIDRIIRDAPLLDVIDGIIKNQKGSTTRRVVFDFFPERMYDARLVPYVYSSTPPHSAKGAVLVMQDVTDTLKSAQVKTDFVANASHELRTPLATLHGFIETLRGSAKDDPKARENFLQIMHEQTARMTRLVNDLLSLSHIEQQEEEAPQEPVNVLSVAQSAIDVLRPTAAQRHVSLVLEQGSEPITSVPGDEDQLAQVFQNLIENAIKYTRENTSVTVKINCFKNPAGEQQVSVAIVDQGEGVAPNHIPRLTERFYRVDPARSRRLGGTGLGLAIVKHIVHRHQGSFHIDSTLGQGSTFMVTFPATKTDSLPLS